jgi:hypothetical protein
MARGSHHQQASGQALLFGQRRRGQRPAVATTPAPSPLACIERALAVADRIATQALITNPERQSWQDFSKSLTTYLETVPLPIDQAPYVDVIWTGFRQTITNLPAFAAITRRRHASLVKAIIDRDLLDLKPPRNHREAFSQSMALLNNKPMPDAHHFR